MLLSGSSAVKFKRRITECEVTCDLARTGLDPIPRCAGAADDCRRGEDPMFVLNGERPGGGGNSVWVLLSRRRPVRTPSGSGIEPVRS